MHRLCSTEGRAARTGVRRIRRVLSSAALCGFCLALASMARAEDVREEPASTSPDAGSVSAPSPAIPITPKTTKAADATAPAESGSLPVSPTSDAKTAPATQPDQRWAGALGRSGTLVLDELLSVNVSTGQTGFGGLIGYTRLQDVEGRRDWSHKTVSFEPKLHIFVTDRLSIGIDVALHHTKLNNKEMQAFNGPDGSSTERRVNTNSTVFTWHLAPSIGYALPLGEKMSLWSRGSVGFGRGTTSGQVFLEDSPGYGTSFPDLETTTFSVAASLMWTYRVVPAVMFSAGPFVEHRTVSTETVPPSEESLTNVGLRASLSLVFGR